jgi:thiazole biosynthesis protein thiG
MINKLLGIKYPILQGGMANISTGSFAAVVSNSGALGVIASGGMDKDTLREEIRVCKSKTDGVFGVNLMLLHPQIDELAKIVIEEKVPVVTTGAGNPSKYIESWKKEGIKVIPVVPNSTLARRVEQYGADAVIAEGCESGGHIGPMTTMTIVNEVVQEIKIPVIAAGGICNGKQMVASEILGAQGMQMGTVFLATKECPIHENYRNAVLKASSNNITVTGYSIGMPVRLIKNDMSRKYLAMERKGEDKMELEKFTLGSMKKAVLDGDISNGSVMAGLVVGQINKISTVEETIERLMSEYYSEWEKIGEKYKTKRDENR